MGKGSQKKKLHTTHKIWICQKLAEYKTDSEIVAGLKDRFDIELRPQSVDYYRKTKKWQRITEKLRDAWLKAVAEVPIANKRVRLQRAEQVYQAAMQSRLTRSPRVGTDENGHPVHETVEEVNADAALRALREAREEVEGVVIEDRRGLRIREEQEKRKSTSTAELTRELAVALEDSAKGG